MMAVWAAAMPALAGTEVGPTLSGGCPDFAVERPRDREGGIVHATDFGFSTQSDKNATAINSALNEARRTGAKRVELAPGMYRCFDEDGIVISGFTDFTFDGKGAVLVFRRPSEYRGQPQSELILTKGNVLVDSCERTEVGNFILDWDWEKDPLGAFVRVVARHEDTKSPENSYVDLVFVDWDRYPRYPNPVPVQKVAPMDECRTQYRFGSVFSGFGQTEGHFGPRNEWIAPNVLRLWPQIPMEGRNQNPMTGFIRNPEGNLAAVRRFEDGGLYRILHYYYGKNGINLNANHHLGIRNVTVWSCFGMAMVTDGPEKYTEIENFKVVPPDIGQFVKTYPGVKYRPRPVTSTSDGFHVARSQGFCRLLDCVWILNNDDSINFHDRFTIAVRGNDRMIEVINRRGAGYFRVATGAEIELRRPNFAPIGFRAKVERVKGDRIYVDRTLPPQEGQCFLVWDRTYGTDNVLIKGCVFEGSGARNILSPSNLTVEDCIFHRTGGEPLCFIADYRSNLWCEGMGASNLVVRGCSFEDVNVLRPKRAVITSVCVTPPGWDVGKIDPGFVGGGLRIEDCKFIRPTGPVLDLSSGRDVVFRNSLIDMRGVDTNAWPGAGQVLTNGVDGFRASGIVIKQEK